MSDYDVNPTRMTVDNGGAMPQDVEAEASVLSAMMVSTDALQECLIDLSTRTSPWTRSPSPTTSRALVSWSVWAAAASCWASATTRSRSWAGAVTWRCSTVTPPSER